MKKCFVLLLAVIMLTTMLIGCSKTNTQIDIPQNDDASIEEPTDNIADDENIEDVSTSEDENNKDVKSEDNNTVTEKENENIPLIPESHKNPNEYELVRTESFNEYGYAWITVKQDGVKSYALLDNSLNVCFILQLDYDEISRISPFEFGSALIEMNDETKHIVGSDGSITYTLDKNVYDNITQGSNGYYMVSRTTSGFDDYGTDYGIVDAYGSVVIPLQRINGFRDVGSGIFATSTNVGKMVFYNAATKQNFEIDDLVPNFLWLHSGDVFINGEALVELGSGRMSDKAAITYANNGQTYKIDINTEYAFYEYGPISDGGFIYSTHSYEYNRGDVVSSVRYFDMETYDNYSIFDQPERIKYEDTTTPLRDLKFVDGYVAIEMFGADGKTYFSIIDKYGDVTYGPQSGIKSLKNIGEGYFLLSNDEGNKIIKANGEPGLDIIPKYTFSCGYAVDRTGRNYIDRDGNIVFENDLIIYKQSETLDTETKVTVGEKILFGHYEQDTNSNNGKEPIEWMVLEVLDDKCLLISEHCIDCLPYNDIDESVTWETCTLRAWLNDSFFNNAFDIEEQERIILTNIVNSDNQQYSVDGGNDTEDKVFVLNDAEANKYFGNGLKSKVLPTKFSEDNGTWIRTPEYACWWWLRGPSDAENRALIVEPTGEIWEKGMTVDYDKAGIRPCVWVSFN